MVTNGIGTAVNGTWPVARSRAKRAPPSSAMRSRPEAHAWFVGYQNDLAFAVFVEGGEFGGSTAAADRRRLPQPSVAG